MIGIDPPVAATTADLLRNVGRYTDELSVALSGIANAAQVDAAGLIADLRAASTLSKHLSTTVEARSERIVVEPVMFFRQLKAPRPTPPPAPPKPVYGPPAPASTATSRFDALWRELGGDAASIRGPLSDLDAERFATVFADLAQHPTEARGVLDRLGPAGLHRLLGMVEARQHPPRRLTPREIGINAALFDRASRVVRVGTAAGSTTFEEMALDRKVSAATEIAIALTHVPAAGETRWPPSTLGALLDRIPADYESSRFRGEIPLAAVVDVPTANQLLRKTLLADSLVGGTAALDWLEEASSPFVFRLRTLHLMNVAPLIEGDLYYVNPRRSLDTTAADALLRELLVVPFEKGDVAAQTRAINLFERMIADPKIAEQASPTAADTLIEAFVHVALARPDEFRNSINGWEGSLGYDPGERFRIDQRNLASFLGTMAARTDTRPALFAAVSILSASMIEGTPNLAGDAGTLFGLTLRAIDARVAGENAQYEAKQQAWTAFFGLVTSLASAAITAGTGGGATLGKGVVAKWAFSTGLGKSLGVISSAATTAVIGPAPDLASQFPTDRFSWSNEAFVLSWMAAYPDLVSSVAAEDSELRPFVVNGRLTLPDIGVHHDAFGRVVTSRDVRNLLVVLQTALMRESSAFAAAITAYRGAAIDRAGSDADS